MRSYPVGMPAPKPAAARRKDSSGSGVRIKHGIAIGSFIAGVGQGVERERIVFGGGERSFHQSALDGDFNFAEDLHGGKSYSTTELRIALERSCSVTER